MAKIQPICLIGSIESRSDPKRTSGTKSGQLSSGSGIGAFTTYQYISRCYLHRRTIAEFQGDEWVSDSDQTIPPWSALQRYHRSSLGWALCFGGRADQQLCFGQVLTRTKTATWPVETQRKKGDIRQQSTDEIDWNIGSRGFGYGFQDVQAIVGRKNIRKF